MTGVDNLLEQLRRGEALSAKERENHEQGLVAVLAQLHDELDTAVLEAYNWQDLAPALVGKPGGTTPYSHKSPEQSEAEEALLGRLVTLNAERAAEESKGMIRWLRPEFQNPQGRKGAQETLIEGIAPEEETAPIAGKRPWPKTLSEQVRAVRAALAEQPGPATPAQLAKAFKGAQAKRVTELLQTLDAIGQARMTRDGRFAST
jgi:hypothetical protein